MSSSTMWRRYVDATKWDARSWQVVLNIFECEKNWIFQFLTKGTSCLQKGSHKNRQGMIKSHTISFYKVAVLLIKFAIKDVKMTRNGFPTHI